MSLLNVGLLDAITAKMTWADQNQKVLAGNIANADTPNAKAQELKPVDFSTYLSGVDGASGAGKLHLAATNGAHISDAKRGGNGALGLTDKKEPYEVAPSKNSVILEQQLVAAQKNAMDYNLAANMYRKSVGMVKLALGVNR